MQPAFATAKKQTLRNPEKWLGRSVLHLGNWREYQYTDKYFVCEWTGKLCRMAEEGVPAMDTELLAAHSPYDPCYSYSDAAITYFERLVEAKLGL